LTNFNYALNQIAFDFDNAPQVDNEPKQAAVAVI